MKRKLSLAFAAAIALSAIALTQEYQGTSSLLKRLTELTGGSAVPQGKTQVDLLRKDLLAFQTAASALPPKEAAEQWLAFVDRLSALSREERYGPQRGLDFDNGNNFNFGSVVAALPPPAAWPEIVKAIEARPKAAGKNAKTNLLLNLFAHTLANRPDARWEDLAELRALLQKTPGSFASSSLDYVTTPLLEIEADTKRVLAFFDERLTAAEKNVKGRDETTLEVPDLMQLTDEPATRKFLRRVLLLPPHIEANFSEDRKTKAVARQVALGLVSQLPSSPWKIMDSFDSTVLFEAVDKKFPAKTKEDFEARETAAVYYLFGLLLADRTADAVKFALTQPNPGDHFSDGLDVLEKNGKGAVAFAFLNELLPRQPESFELWEEFIPLAARVGESARMLATLRSTIAQEKLPPTVRLKLREQLAPALLAADEIEDGVKELQAIIASAAPEPAADDASRWSSPADRRFASAGQLAKIGQLMGRQDWIEAGIAGAQRITEEALKVSPTSNSRSTLAGLFMELDRGPQAEKWLHEEALARGRSPEDQGRTLATLLLLYDQAGRTDDVLDLLDKAPDWGVSDLSKIPTVYVKTHSTVSLAAARALAAKGRTNEARQLVHATLEKQGGLDPAYEFLIKLDGPAVLPQLDQLAAQDRFEERPLIWKAQLQLDAGQLDDAEKSARAAIAIDPSDGEQPKNDRMRAYAVLAGILEKKGDPEQAKVLRGAVEAIRLSEKADDWWQAGLLTRAVKMYEEALTHFADAYCIQSRLALRYADLGQMDKAELHYRRAYELMPDSFGRMESHCFGCERAFAGFRAQSLAEKVFTSLIAKSPEKPQLHYLLGYLRQQQDQPAEALVSYRQAVKLDPDYLNAWKKIAGLRNDIRLPATDADAAVLNQIRLDPLNRHDWSDITRVTDLNGLWLALEAARKLQPPDRTSLYPLAASKAALERAPAPAKQSQMRFYFRERAEVPTPGQAVAKIRVVEAINALIEQSSME